jgi:hypothetical protein
MGHAEEVAIRSTLADCFLIDLENQTTISVADRFLHSVQHLISDGRPYNKQIFPARAPTMNVEKIVYFAIAVSEDGRRVGVTHRRSTPGEPIEIAGSDTPAAAAALDHHGDVISVFKISSSVDVLRCVMTCDSFFEKLGA